MNNFAISSKFRPFVSGTTKITKNTANAQNTEYIQKVPAVVISCLNRINTKSNSYKYVPNLSYNTKVNNAIPYLNNGTS